MKKMFCLLTLLTLSQSAHAAISVKQLIAEHPVVKATTTLMNAKYGDCKTPIQEDVATKCSYEVAAVTEPTLVPVGCSFTLAIECSSGRADLSGAVTAYQYASPDKEARAIMSDSAITFDDVKISAKMP